MRRIKEFNPAARIVLILRKPVDFIASLHKEFVKGVYEDRTDIADALRLEPQRRQGSHLPPFVPFPRWVFYSDWIRYYDHLQLCFAHFPRNQVRILLFEEWRQDNARAFRDIAGWLGVDPAVEPRFRDVNRYGEGELSRAARWLFHPRIRAAVRAILPRTMHSAVWSWSRRLLWRESPEPRTDKTKIREILHDEINETIERTSEILGRDLYEVWGEGARHEKSEDQQQSAPDRASQ